MLSFPLFVSRYDSKPQQLEVLAVRKSDLRKEQASLHCSAEIIADGKSLIEPVDLRNGGREFMASTTKINCHFGVGW